MSDVVLYVKCRAKPTLKSQINRAIQKTEGKYAERLNFQEDGFNVRLPEEKRWTFVLSLAKDGMVVENTRVLARKPTRPVAV